MGGGKDEPSFCAPRAGSVRLLSVAAALPPTADSRAHAAESGECNLYSAASSARSSPSSPRASLTTSSSSSSPVVRRLDNVCTTRRPVARRSPRHSSLEQRLRHPQPRRRFPLHSPARHRQRSVLLLSVHLIIASPGQSLVSTKRPPEPRYGPSSFQYALCVWN